MHDENYAKELLEKYKMSEATEFERAQVEDWFAHGILPQFEISDDELDLQLASISNALPLKRNTVPLWPRVAAAAVIIICLGTSVFYLRQSRKHLNANNLQNKIVPGKNSATLTLANGKKIILSDAANGKLAEQAGVSISKTKNGQLVYTIKTTGTTSKSTYNTLSTSNGEQYMIRLPDGTSVWLNAGSGLTYATNLLVNGQRRVELRGEAYFEVAKDKDHPFHVRTADQEVEVLGTHFDINSYGGKNKTKTTLLEGSVKVTAEDKTETLKPGQEVVLTDKMLIKNDVEADYAITWKNGFFMFNNEDLQTIMEKVARWYNVDVVYENEEIKKDTFFGTISKYENINKVLNMLEGTGTVKFSIDNQKVIVTKKEK